MVGGNSFPLVRGVHSNPPRSRKRSVRQSGGPGREEAPQPSWRSCATGLAGQPFDPRVISWLTSANCRATSSKVSTRLSVASAWMRWLPGPATQVIYSVGWELGERERAAIAQVPARAWQIAIDHPARPANAAPMTPTLTADARAGTPVLMPAREAGSGRHRLSASTRRRCRARPRPA